MPVSLTIGMLVQAGAALALCCIASLLKPKGERRSLAPWLVVWLSRIETGFVNSSHLGWLSGWLMVLPNALLALYYSWRGQTEVVYSSQVGDGHICIPLCVGVFAIMHPIRVPDFFNLGLGLIGASALAHLVLISCFRKLPRWIGALLSGAYFYFVYQGLIL